MKDASSLPEGWAIATIGEITVDRVPQAAPRAEAVPYIDISSIDRERKAIGPLDSVTTANAPTRARQWVVPGDVLVSMTRPNLNAVARVLPEHRGAVASTGFDVLRSAGVVPEWLLYRVQSHEFITDVCRGLQGVVYPAIRPHDVRRHRIPVPPEPELRRIVTWLESCCTRLDHAVATLERVQQSLKRYRASVLNAAVEGRLVPTEAELARVEGRDYEPASVLLERILAERRRRESELARTRGKRAKDDDGKARYKVATTDITADPLRRVPKGWQWVPLSLVAEVQLGQQRHPKYAASPHRIPYVRAANLTWDGLDLSSIKAMGFPDAQRYRLEYGDLLLSEASGSPMEAGKPIVWREEIPDACYQKTLLRVRPFDKQLVLPEYLRAFFLHVCVSGQFAKLAPGVGIVHITAERLSAWLVPLPPAAEQRRIVAEAQRLFSVAGNLVSTTAHESKRCVRLRQAVLKWAFEGKLVEQDPNDEPASVLLERIRAARTDADKQEASKRPRRVRKER